MNNFEPKDIKLASKHLEEKLTMLRKENIEKIEVEKRPKERKKTLKNIIKSIFKS